MKKNKLVFIEVFKGLSCRTNVYFHRQNRCHFYRAPGQKSLDRLTKLLQGARIYLNEAGIYIQKWIGEPSD